MPADPLNRAAAQQRADRLRILNEELDRLELEGVVILSEPQRAAVSEHIGSTLRGLAEQFDIDTTESEKSVSWGMRIAATLGGMALCAALILFFLRFWGHLTSAAQIAVTTLLVFATLAAVEVVARRERTLYFAALLSLVALAAFILNLTVIGVVFNIASTPGALLAWGLFAGLLAYRYELRIQLVAGLLLLLSWLSAVAAQRFGLPWEEFLSRPELVAAGGVAVFVLPAAFRHGKLADFPAVYRVVGAMAVYLPLLALSEGAFSSLPWSGAVVKPLYGFLALGVSGGIIALSLVRGWHALVYVSSAFFALFLMLRLSHWLWDLIPGYLFFALIGLLAILLVAVFKRVRSRMAAS